MQRYYFHILTPHGRENDDEGIVFKTLDDAIADAKRAAGEMLVDDALEAVKFEERAFEICDRDGRALATVPFLLGARGGKGQ